MELVRPTWDARQFSTPDIDIQEDHDQWIRKPKSSTDGSPNSQSSPGAPPTIDDNLWAALTATVVHQEAAPAPRPAWSVFWRKLKSFTAQPQLGSGQDGAPTSGWGFVLEGFPLDDPQPSGAIRNGLDWIEEDPQGSTSQLTGPRKPLGSDARDSRVRHPPGKKRRRHNETRSGALNGEGAGPTRGEGLV
jgi:hypothetical protein